MRPRVSVIMIFLNAEKFIEEAITSVLEQTYDVWELLLVDDGSTDRSTTIAREYARTYPAKIRYFEHTNHQNLGMSASRNLGLSNAAGENIAFLDADDVWFAHALERQVEILAAHPQAAMVYGGAQMWYSWTGDPNDTSRDYMRRLGVDRAQLFGPQELIPLFLLKTFPTPAMCSLMVRHQVARQVGGFEKTFRSMYEDQVFITKVCLGNSVLVANECWSRYRQHPDSSCAIAQQNEYFHLTQPNKAHENFLIWLERHLLEQNITTPALRQALRKAQRPYRVPFMFESRKIYQGVRRRMKRYAIRLGQQPILAPLDQFLRSRYRPESYTPPVNKVRPADLQRVTPISRCFGLERGQPVDRYYIEQFLALHAYDIRGRVLEIGDNSYTRAFGLDRVAVSNILHVVEGNSQATIVGDLTSADHIPSDTFDCIILTQTLHLIYDIDAAIATIYRILKPGGIVLATFPGISQISQDEWSSTWYWSFTSQSAQRFFGKVFSRHNILVGVYGNVRAATAFLYGLASHELETKELDYRDPQYEVLITVRAVKPHKNVFEN